MKTPPTTPCAILVRVSTDKQSTERQIRELQQLAANRGWTVVKIIGETITGDSKTRPGMDMCRTLARAGTIKKVLVHEVSRVARRNSIAHAFIEDLAEAGTSLYWHCQQIETLLPDGKRNPAASLMFSILAEMARAERETLIERINSGLANARRNGVVLGRRKGTAVPTSVFLQKNADVVRRLNKGESIRTTASATRKSKGTVEKVARALKELEVAATEKARMVGKV